MDIKQSLQPMLGQPYDELNLLNHLKERKYSDFELTNLIDDNVRIHMKLYDEDRTLFVKVDEAKNVLEFIFLNKKTNSSTDTLSNVGIVGCLLGVVIALGLFIWLLVFIFTPNETYDSDYDYDYYKPDPEPRTGEDFDQNKDGILDSNEMDDWYEYKTTNDDDGDF